jgi:hypothetical protein
LKIEFVILIGIVLTFGGIAVAASTMASMLGTAQKQAQANAVANEIIDRQVADVATRLREVALERQKSGNIPDPETEFERTLNIDSIAIAMSQQGIEMPGSYRTLLSHLTIDELKEILSYASL